VRRFQAGDREAFGILYKRYFERVFNYMKVVLRDTHEAEDATQDVFAKALAGMKDYEQRDRPFRAWLFAIVRNHAIAMLRKLGRIEPMDPEDLDRKRETEGAEEQELPVLDWIADRDLVLFVERLPLPQQQVLLLRFLLDLPNEDIAKAMNLTQNHVRVLQTRALDFLRERLTAIGREPKSGRRPAMVRCPEKARVLRERRFALWN
jgi:RNA polymerase sigma-70 factor (ECF subfamily)